MTLHNKIRGEYQECFKKKCHYIDQYRFLLGELTRGQSKEKSDSELITIFQKLQKSFIGEHDSGRMNDDEFYAYMHIFDQYVPKQATEVEIKGWILNNVDFSQYRSKMESMKTIMGHFGKTADGNLVKKIINEL